MKNPIRLTIACLLIACPVTLWWVYQNPSSGLSSRPLNGQSPSANSRSSNIRNESPASGISASAAATRDANADDHALTAAAAIGAAPAAQVGEALPGDFLERIVHGKALSFALPDGSQVEGTVEMSGSDESGLAWIQGRLTKPAAGTCYIRRQSFAGKAGPFAGNVRFDGKTNGWKIEPSDDLLAARFVARHEDQIVCAQIEVVPPDDEEKDKEAIPLPPDHPTNQPLPPYQNVISLQSIPGAAGVIYLDFDGETGPFSGWGSFDAAPSGASNAQVFDVWKMVCEDYQGFNLNITTDRKVYDQAAQGQRMHVIITPTTTASPGNGGVAYVGSYNWGGDTPCWAFYTTGTSACAVISHEVGHTLGLSHDGRTSPSEGYYDGHGSGATSWGPIMGSGYYANLTQWSKGEYINANNLEDDLAIITSNNNAVAYRADDCGETLETAQYLEISSGNSVNNEGFIGKTGDVDSYRFVTSGGQATLNANTASAWPDLDILAEIVNATTGAVITSNNPDTGINATVSSNLPAGEYLLRIRGTGRGDPLGDGYTNYGCLGGYMISGSVVGGVQPYRFSLAENPVNNATIGTVAARGNHGANPLTWSIDSGNDSGGFTIDSATGTLKVANPAIFDYELQSPNWTDPATLILFVRITDSINPASNEYLRVVVTVTDANDPPYFPSNPFACRPGTPGEAYQDTLVSSDQDATSTAPTYSKISGPSWLTVASNGALSGTPAAGDLGVNSFTMRVTDSGSAFSDATVTINVVTAATSPYWTNSAGGSWTTAGNWLGGVIANGQSQTGDFSTLNLSANATVTLDGARTIGGLKFGDTVPSHNWTLDPGSGGTLTLAPLSGSPVISVTSQIATINAVLASTQGITKTGAGTAVITNTGASGYTGATVVSAGTLTFTTNVLNSTSGYSLNDTNTGSSNTALRLVGGFTSNRTGVGGITLRDIAPVTITNNGTGTATLEIDSSTSNWPNGLVSIAKAVVLKSSGAGGVRSGFVTISGNGAGAGNDSVIYDASGSGNDNNWNSYEPTGTYTPMANSYQGNVRFTGGTTIIQNKTYANAAYVNMMIPDTARVTIDAGSGINFAWGSESFDGLNDGTGGGGSITSSSSTVPTISLGVSNGSGSFSGIITSGLSLVKAGTGTQTLGGGNTYTGTTTVSGGTLQVNGSLAAGSAVTVNSGAILSGTGTVNGTVTLSSGSTLSAGTANPGTLTLANTLNLHTSGTVSLRIRKTGGNLTSDRLNLTSSSALVYKGTLAISLVAGSDSLALGDTFTVMPKSSGAISGSFASIQLPTLSAGLEWETSLLSVNGTISVKTTNTPLPPVYSIPSGGYMGPQSVSIHTTSGASIRYTTDGSDPFSSGTAVSGATPVTVAIAAPANITIRAYAFKAGQSNSTETSASYGTVPQNGVTWTNASGGSWPVTGNWLYGVVANGSNTTARFDTLNLSSNPVVTLDGSQTLGSITFGDTGNLYSWTLATGSGGSLTLDATGTPAVNVVNRPAFISAVLSGSKGLSKIGTGTLVLTGSNNYTGTTSITSGTLQIGDGTTGGSIHSASPVSIAANTAAMWSHNSNRTIANAISGSGQWILQGTNATNALQQSLYTPSGNNSGFTGEFIINRASTWNVTNPNQIGSGLVRVQDRGTLAVNGGATIANSISIENGAGWHHNVSGDVVIGALRLEGNNTFSGNLQLNQSTGVANGDNTGANSTIGSWATANNAFSGLISGSGELSMSRYTSWNSGTPQTVDIDITGTTSNTFTGRTVVDGQGGVASLRLMKTGGAVAIPGGNIIQLGSNTSGQANLRMGDTTATGTARDPWNNQFGTTNGGVVLNFANASGQWMRVDLQGTQQSVAGLNSGTLTTQGGGVIQNQNLQAFDPGQDATLTLIGSGSYLYNGYLRDQDNSGNTRKLNLIKNGSGTQTLAGSQITLSGNTTVNSGRLILANGAQQAMKGTSVVSNTGGILELNLTADQDLGAVNTVFTGGGIIQKTGTAKLRVGFSGSNRDHTISQSAGGVLDVQAGDLNIGWTNVAFNGNQGGLNLATTGKLHNSQAAGMQFDWLSGAGDLNNAYNSTTPTVTLGVANTVNNAAYGVANNTASFSGRIGYAESYNGATVGTLNLIKTGSGTQILSGVCGYTGTTSVNGGTLLINGSLANTATTIASAGTLGGTGTVAGAVTNNGTLAPGNNAVGNFTINNTVTLANSSAINWDISNWTGAAGTGWDKLTTTSLNLTATSANPIVIRLKNLALTNFSEANSSFVFAQTTSGITGFSANKFLIDTSAFVQPQGTWAVQQSGNNLLLVYTTGTNSAPSFTADPINLSGTEDNAFSGTLSATDPDAGDTLTFSKVSGPAWLSVAANGALSGTPSNSNVGSNAFIVRVTDSHGATDDAALNITVVNVNDAPTFTIDPINLSATEDSAFSGQLAATDIDSGDSLTYTKVSGPAWLSVSNSGALSGTPSNSNVGTNNFVVRVTDGSGATDDAALNITVANVNDAPTFTSNPVNKPAATETLAYSGTLTDSVTDVDAGDTLTYSKISGPAWLSIASNGALSGTPATSDIGANAFSVRVTDAGGLFADATLNITVNANVNSGTWTNIAGGSWPSTGNWQSGTIASGANATANFNTLNLTADTTVTLDGARTLGILSFGDTTPSNNWALNTGSGGPLTLSVSSGNPVITVANQTTTINAVLAGTQGLVKSGNGTLTLAALNTYTGGTTVNAGELALKVPSDADWTMPGGAATIATGGTLKVDLTAQTTQYRKSTLGAITLNSNGVLNLHGTVDNINSHYLIQSWSGASGPGTIRLAGGGSIAVWTNTNPLSGFTGLLDIQNGRFVSNVNSSITLGGNFDVTMAAAGKLDLRSGHLTIDALDGVAGSQVHKSWTGDTINFTVGSGNGSGNFAGAMNGTNYNLIKSGTGTQTLSGTNTYTGSTTVNGGVLLVNGSLANTVTTIAATGTLGGSGTIAGTVTNNGTLAPGNASVGNLTVNNTVTLANSSALNLEFSNWTGAAGTGWDNLTATSLNITATSGSPVTLRLSETALANFTEANTSFVIAQTTSGITGFSASKFTIDSSALTTPHGTWAIQQSGNNLLLAYTRSNTAPLFSADPILVNATEDSAISGSISANDPDLGETLTYTKDSGPAWLSVASNGALSGTPTNSEVGVNTFSVHVTDSFGAEDTATLQITVANTNDAPGFISNPIFGSSATEDSAYSASIAGTATDVDAGDTLTYSKVSGPAWLNVAANGALSGTPANSDVGGNAFTVRVTDGSGAFANATLNISVTNINDAPTFTSNPITGTAATEDSAYSASIAGAATDVDAGDTLTYSKVSGPAWLSVASNGALSGTPTNSEVGANAFTVRVTDAAGAFANATLNITVTNTNDAPIFTVDPILKADGSVGTAYTGQTLAGSATDVDSGDTLTYSKVSGPAWLSVASNGALSGTPPTGSTGLNTFIVRVTDNASATDDAELRINVQGLPLPWTNSDIGTGMLAGSTSHSSDTFTEAGSGALGGTTDKLQFAYQTLTGDGEIIARISSLQDTGTSSRVGVMIRDTLATNSKQIFMGLTGSGSYRWVRRSSTGGSNSTNNSSTGTVPNTWVKLARNGSTIIAYKSSDGASWTTVGSTTVTMATNCYIGLAVSSGSNTTLNTSQFSNVSVTP